MEYPLHPLPGEEDHGRSVEDDPNHADGHAEGAVQPVLHLAAKEGKGNTTCETQPAFRYFRSD